MGGGNGRPSSIERRVDGGALRREARPAGAERGACPCQSELPGAGTARSGRGRTRGRNEPSRRRLLSEAAAQRAPLSTGRQRGETRPLFPANQGTPARPRRKALWDGGGKRGGRWRVAGATGGAVAVAERAHGRARRRCGPGRAREAAGSGAGGAGAPLPSGEAPRYSSVVSRPLYSGQQLPVLIPCLSKARWFPVRPCRGVRERAAPGPPGEE